LAGFDLFVILAEMRTGSNLLESNLNAYVALHCHGEAFNPGFMGYPNQNALLGVTREERERDPLALLDAIRTAEGLAGFRYFHDHDPRIFDVVMDDPRCAKIVLTRNPAESYVSWKIARATGQWKLTEARHQRARTVRFNAAEFEAHLAALQEFQVRVLGHLQRSGQTAFWIAYEDLQDIGVMNGLASWLGAGEKRESLGSDLKKQNPAPMAQKVENFSEMELALARLDRFNLSRTPNFEPRRGPVVPSYAAARGAPLLYAPVRGGSVEGQIRGWLASLGAEGGGIEEGFTQKSLRAWRAGRPGHIGFTVLSHPAVRAHTAFCRRILATGPGTYAAIRASLRRLYRLPLPDEAPTPETYSAEQHREAFLAFLRFLKANLAGQTSIRTDATWASQAQVVRGFSEVAPLDFLAREDRLEEDLGWLAARVGARPAPLPEPEADVPHTLEAIYDDEIEAAARAAYARDYEMLGFTRWR